MYKLGNQTIIPMIKFIYVFIPIFYFFSSCGSASSEPEIQKEEEQAIELADVTNEKKELVAEILVLYKDLDSQELDKITNYLDCPKRIEEIELPMEKSKIRNAVESNSFRLSSDVVKEHFDLLYTEMDLNLIHETIKQIPEEELLTKDEVSSKINVSECDYETKVSMLDKEVKFNIIPATSDEKCKKDQQWKFKSNGEYLVLDRRYYL